MFELFKSRIGQSDPAPRDSLCRLLYSYIRRSKYPDHEPYLFLRIRFHNKEEPLEDSPYDCNSFFHYKKYPALCQRIWSLPKALSLSIKWLYFQSNSFIIGKII